MKHERIQDRMRGRWKSVLPLLGLDSSYFTGKHGPCPLCRDHGKDRWRFDDKGGEGTWYCNRCGAGNGIDLVMKLRGVIFIEAVKLLEQQYRQCSDRHAEVLQVGIAAPIRPARSDGLFVESIAASGRARLGFALLR
jgi:putative DNA primase/helicase